MKPSELLTGPEKWTQGRWAETADGKPISASSPYAVRWCLYGAVCYCYPDANDQTAAAGRISKVLASYPSGWYERPNLVSWNDFPGRVFQDVRQLLQQAGE